MIQPFVLKQDWKKSRKMPCRRKALFFTVVLFISFQASLAVALSSSKTTQPRTRLPNIILLLTDDQDVMVGGMAHMPILRQLLQDRGMTFENAFVHTPICCCSRSSILSGHYLHNGGALNNSVEGNCYGELWQNQTELHTFANILKTELGYQTSFAGKYLNQYGIPGSPGCHQDETTGQKSDACRKVPPGWDRWLGLIGNSQYYNYGVIRSVNGSSFGEEIIHQQSYEDDYLPDLVANFTLESIQQFASSMSSSSRGERNTTVDLSHSDVVSEEEIRPPFLLVVAWPTAHMPFTPAPWAESFYSNISVMKTPNYNASWESLQSKHWMMRWLAPIDPDKAAHDDYSKDGTEGWMNQVYRNRTRALMSVDRHIQQFVKSLQDTNVYDDTWIIYTSDNGWQLGQHRLSFDKRQLYEHDIRVPFVVLGPSVPPNTTNHKIVMNIDLAPTFLDIALQGVQRQQQEQKGLVGTNGDVLERLQSAMKQMDGISFLPSISHEKRKRPTSSNDQHDGNPDIQQTLAHAKYDSVRAKNNDDKNRNKTLFRTDFLITYHGDGLSQCDNFWDCPAPHQGDENYHMGDWSNNTYHCVRTILSEEDQCNDDDDNGEKVNKKEENGNMEGIRENSIYCRFLDDEQFIEYYDLKTDPWQLNNAYDSLTLAERIRYERRLHGLRTCRGESCRSVARRTSTTTSHDNENTLVDLTSLL